ncbi:hypothetical protein D3C72_1876590 [compost metagenome]
MLDGVELGHARGRVDDAVVDLRHMDQRRAHLRLVHGFRAALDGAGGGHRFTVVEPRRLHWRQTSQRQQRRHRAHHPKCLPHANSTA